MSPGAGIATQAQASVIERICSVVIPALCPRRMILIGSRARCDAAPDSDYDLVVEFDRVDDAMGRAASIYALCGDRDYALDVVIRVAGEIERSAHDPGSIDWDIVREGRVVYSATGSYDLPMARTRAR